MMDFREDTQWKNYVNDVVMLNDIKSKILWKKTLSKGMTMSFFMAVLNFTVAFFLEIFIDCSEGRRLLRERNVKAQDTAGVQTTRRLGTR